MLVACVIIHPPYLLWLLMFVNYTVIYKTKVERKYRELVDEDEPRKDPDCSSVASTKSEIYNEEAGNATQKHKPKRVESVNADAEAVGDH